MMQPLKRSAIYAASVFFLLLVNKPSAYSQYSGMGPEEFTGEEVLIEEPQLAVTDSLVQSIPDSLSFREGFIPQYADELIADQMRCLENEIPLTFNNTTKGFINYFTERGRSFTATTLQRKHLYFPIFEAALRRHGLPEELKYLSIIESGLNPRAKSPVGAAGLWQFMPPTGRQFRLYQDAYVDERLDPYESTEAACVYLKQLYDMFGNWELVLASYNWGPGNMRRAIRRSGNKTDFWQLYNYLPRETRAYVPQFIAITYVMNHADLYNFQVDSLERYIPSDTIFVNQHVNMELLGKQLDVSLNDLRLLNPHLKRDAVPAHLKNYLVRIPAEKKSFFAANRSTIMDSVSLPGQATILLAAQDKDDHSSGKKKVIHRVRSGDVLGRVADKYNVSIASLRHWNNLRGNTIRVGQRLAVWVNPRTANRVAQAQAQVRQENQAAAVQAVTEGKVYLVQPGDTLWKISQNHGGISVEKIKKLNNLKSNELKPGQKLILG